MSRITRRGQTDMSGAVIIDILDLENDERDPLCDEEMSSSDEPGKVLDAVPEVEQNTTSPNSCYQSQHSQRLESRKDPVLPLFHGKDPLDQTSCEGKFSWLQLSYDRGFLPCIQRLDPETDKLFSYVSVKMVEKSLLTTLKENLPGEIVTGICQISSHRVTEAEAKLLFEINLRHCDNVFGRNESFTRDLLVKSEDFLRYFDFLHLCHDKIVLKRSSEHQQCGFVRINGTCDVPYIIINSMQYMPLFYFEGEIGEVPRRSVGGWDWWHLKFCCKVQGVKDEVLPDDSCPVVALQDLRDSFSPGSTFQEYWPSMDFVNKVFSKKSSETGAWTRQVLNHGKKFRGKLSKLKDFPVKSTSEPAAYRAQKALIDKRLVQSVNIRPCVYQDMLVTLPSLVEQLFHEYSEHQIGDLLLEQGILLYAGNYGQREVLRRQGWMDVYKELPLVRVKDILDNLESLKSSLGSVSSVEKRSQGI